MFDCTNYDDCLDYVETKGLTCDACRLSARSAYERTLPDGVRIALAIARFPEVFGLSAFRGSFRVDPARSFVGDGDVVQLYLVQRVSDGSRWEAFTRGTESELRTEVRPL